jgi:hypothetical protein
MDGIKIVKGAVSGAVDALLSVNPAMAVAWGAIKGGVAEARGERAVELLTFIEQNCTVVQFNDPSFVDGVGLTFEAYIRERNKQKRQTVKQIFLGFADAKDKERFQLERLYETTKLISNEQLVALNLFKDSNGLEVSSDDRGKTFEHDLAEGIRSLSSLGLVNVDLHVEVEAEEEMEGDMEDGIHGTGRLVPILRKSEYAELTSFGEEFLSYLDKE